MKRTHSISAPVELWDYIEDQRLAKRRNFSAETQELLEYGIMARDNVSVYEEDAE